MSMSRYMILCAFVLWSSMAALFQPARADDPEGAIETARARGEITDSEAILYQFYHMTGSDLLPMRFAGETAVRCGMPILADVADHLVEFPSAAQAQFESMSTRPGGLESWIDTEHFRIHYTSSGEKAPAGWPNTHYLDTVAEAVERCWRFSHETERWNEPPSDALVGGGSNLIDLYIDDLGSSLYGYAQPEVEGVQQGPGGYSAFFVIDNDYAGFGFADATDAVKVTIAHEYHHVVQMGYTIGESWWMENLSTFIEDEVYDDINDNYDYLPCFLSSPHQRLDLRNGCHEYGGFLWPTFLSEMFGHDAIRAIEECSGGSPLMSCFDAELRNHGMDFEEALETFWAWNFYTSIHDDGAHYVEGGDYDRLLGYDRSFSSYPQTAIRPTESKLPAAMSASVLRFNRQSGSQDDIFVLDYDGPRCVGSVTLFQRFPDNRVVEHVVLLDENGNASVQVEDWDQSLYGYLVTVIPRTCGEGRFDYRVNAETTTHSTSVDPATYTRTVVLDQNAPNPFHKFTQIRYSLTERGPVELDIFDSVGRRVRTLVHAEQAAGDFTVSWDAFDDSGQPVESGVYFSRLRLIDQVETRKMILVDD